MKGLSKPATRQPAGSTLVTTFSAEWPDELYEPMFKDIRDVIERYRAQCSSYPDRSQVDHADR
jgi:hypothetical protein